ncbi:MAG: hypothetical protein QOD56_3142 [Gammaproteobacteria bacterium]|nr:hypothetical protein [Gammaproteobacteria bacterium]
MHKSNTRVRSIPGAGIRRVGVALSAACILLCACHKGPTAGDAAASPAEAKPAAGAKSPDTAKEEAGAKEKEAGAKEEAAEGVTLTAEQIEKMGIVAQPVQAIQYTEEASGYGVVVSHDTIAQAAADLATAEATERLSRSALARTKKLDGTPGAVSADLEETSAQKAEIDAAALTATNQKLSSILGMNPPWKNGGKDGTLQALASGRIKLVRVTFPLGALSGAPQSLRATHIGVSKPGAGWKMTSVWDAPADASVPGRSFFALLKASDAGEGERLQVWAPIGESVSGVVIPAAAAVLSESKYWCYVQKKPGTFVKTELDTGKPVADGYFVTEGIEPGNEVVTTSVGQLLAKESASGAEPD